MPNIKTIIIFAAALAIAVLAGKATHWITSSKYERQLADTRLACLSAQLAIVQQTAKHSADTIETVRRENDAAKKTNDAAVARRDSLRAVFNSVRSDAASTDIHPGAVPAAAGPTMATDAAAGESASCADGFASTGAQDALMVLEWQAWYTGIKSDRSDRSVSHDLNAGGG